MMNHPEIKSQDFTTKKNDDTIKVSDNTTIKNSSTENSVKLGNSFEVPKSYPYKEQKPKDSFTLNKEYKTGDIFKIPKFKSTIPNEKLERKRLERLTGAYDLNSVSSEIIEQNKRLKKKTDPNYYRDDKNLTPKEVNQRLDEAFGPKTDFSIHNFENNYDKLNAEEQGMLTHKMQLHFNNVGYGDSQGFHLETDGIFGPKTQGAYKRYISDNKEDYDEAIADKKAYEDYESIVTGDKALKEAELMLKNTNAKPKFSEYTPADVKVNSASDTKTSTSEPKTYEVTKTSYTTSNSNTSKANESEIASQSRTGRNASPVSSRSSSEFSRGNRGISYTSVPEDSVNDLIASTNKKTTDSIVKDFFKNSLAKPKQDTLRKWLEREQLTNGDIVYGDTTGCINGQAENLKVKDIWYGLNTISENGCELLAIYNSLLLSGNKQDFNDIVKKAKSTDEVMMAGGILGSNPFKLDEILKQYNQKYTKISNRADYNKNLSEGGVYIISFWNEPATFTALHTVAFTCDADNNITVYNRYSNVARTYKYYSKGNRTGLDLLLDEVGEDIVMYKIK